MRDDSEREGDPPPEEPQNPSSEELDIEGPNESAPGHELGEGDEGKADPPRPSEA